MKILQITLHHDDEKKPFTDVMGRATVMFVDPADKSKIKGMNISFADGKTKDVTNTDYYAAFNNGLSNALSKADANTREDNGVSATNIDYSSSIKPNLEQAAKLVISEGLVNEGTDRYTIILNKDKSKTKHEFTLNAKKKEGAKLLKGKRLITNYYQFDFTADASGRITMASSE